MKKAVIDIGSNSIRLLITDDARCLSQKHLITTSLGEGLVKNGTLKKERIEDSLSAVLYFYDLAEKEGAQQIFAFATEAVRKASNRDEFLLPLKNSGIAVDILTGDEEARAGFAGAAADSNKSVCVFDIGGASVEIVTGKSGRINYKKSLPLGMHVIKDTCGDDREKIERFIKDALYAYGTIPAFDELIGIGGTATSIAAAALDLDEYDIEKVHRSVVTADAVKALEDECAGFIVNETIDTEKVLARFPSLVKKRAAIIFHGMILTRLIMEYTQKTRYTASETDNMEGYLICQGGQGHS